MPGRMFINCRVCDQPFETDLPMRDCRKCKEAIINSEPPMKVLGVNMFPMWGKEKALIMMKMISKREWKNVGGCQVQQYTAPLPIWIECIIDDVVKVAGIPRESRPNQVIVRKNHVATENVCEVNIGEPCSIIAEDGGMTSRALLPVGFLAVGRVKRLGIATMSIALAKI